MENTLSIGAQVLHVHSGRICTIVEILPGINQLYRVDFGDYSVFLPAQDLSKA